MRLSITKIRAFKSCRREYELRYIEGVTPVHTPEPLEIGRNYHELIEELYNGEEPEVPTTKAGAMFMAYKKYIYPVLKVKAAEVQLEYDLGDGDILQGIADGIAEDGCLVEHKTTSADLADGSYEYDLQWDEQILAYMLMSGSRNVWYTACRKPTIRQKKNETDEEFFERMVEWYDEDTESKIICIRLNRTDDEVAAYEKEVRAMLADMKGCGHFYRNQLWCNRWGRRCEYAPICLHYDKEQEYVDFVKKEVDEDGN